MHDIALLRRPIHASNTRPALRFSNEDDVTELAKALHEAYTSSSA